MNMRNKLISPFKIIDANVKCNSLQDYTISILNKSMFWELLNPAGVEIEKGVPS